MSEIIKTAVAIIINNKKILMEQRRANKTVYPNFLMCPSGHLKTNESPKETITRELKEELNLNILESEELFCINDVDPFSNKEFEHHFLLIKRFDGKIRNSSEAQAIGWYTYKELQKVPIPKVVKRLVEKLKEIGLL